MPTEKNVSEGRKC